jgi:MoxR-like ATPase
LLINIIFSTRQPENYGLDNLKSLIAVGCSPRATINLTIASKAYAFLQGRSFVIPEDIKIIAPDVLRHRIILSYEAEAESLKTEDIIKQVFETIPIP